jgi:hypothetical protein
MSSRVILTDDRLGLGVEVWVGVCVGLGVAVAGDRTVWATRQPEVASNPPINPAADKRYFQRLINPLLRRRCVVSIRILSII